MNSQKKKGKCHRFEPQAWRKTLCKNCFKTKNEHSEEEATDDAQTSDYMSDGASSPEVFMGDKIIVKRNLRTPPPECHTGDFVGLGRRGSDSGGRRTPNIEDQAKSNLMEKATEGNAGFRNEGRVNEEIRPAVVSSGSVEPFSKAPETPIDTSMNNGGSFRPTEQTPPTREPEQSSAPETGDGQGSNPGHPSIEVPSSFPSSPSPSCEAVKASDGEVVIVGGETGTGGFEAENFEKRSLEETRDLGTNQAAKKSEVEKGVKLHGTTYNETSSPINTQEIQSTGAAPTTAESRGFAGHVANVQSNINDTRASPRELETDNVHNRTLNLQSHIDESAVMNGVGENSINSIGHTDGSSSTTTTTSSNRSSESSKCGHREASTKIVQADAEPIGSSYVQSLRISLSSPVPVNAEASLPVGAKESRNSYGIRHGRDSPQLSAAAAAAEGFSDWQAESGSEADKGAAPKSSAAKAVVTQFHLATSANLENLSSSESLSYENPRPPGLNSSDRSAGLRSCLPPPPPPGSPAGREEISAPSCLVTDGVAQSYARPDDKSSPLPLLSTSGYQYVDAGDSRISHTSIDDGVSGVQSVERNNIYYLPADRGSETGPPSGQQPGTGVVRPEVGLPSEYDVGSELSTDEPSRKITSLFHHVPGDSNGYADDQGQSCATSEDSSLYRNQIDNSSNSNNNSSNQQQHPGAGRRRRRSRVISLEDDLGPRTMSAYDYNRSDAMMEGTRMVMESLREKVALLQEQIERQEREKGALGDLLAAKKSDYEMMKDHYNSTIGNLEMEAQRLKSEKSRLLDKLQLPESERASLAAEENEIADLKRRLEEYENRYTEAVGENEDLRQEVRDLQLEMEEMHDQFREEETIEFRELQKELENTAKNCRILQFKLRKSDRRIEQLESDRGQYEEKLRHFESCFQTSDDKRRIRVLEEDLRLAKDSAVRLHADLERAEDRRLKHQEELDRAKNSVNEADNKRLCLQNELDSMKHEMGKLRDQLRFETRHDVIKTGVHKRNSLEHDSTATQLTKDLKDSLERENDLKEQLKFSEEENVTMRKKLLEMEEETESMSLQLRKLSSAKSGRYTKGKSGEVDNEPLTERENEIKLQMELAEQEVKVLKRKMDELQQDNDNLLCAIKYLRSKLEQRDGVRSSTPIDEAKSTKDLLTRIGASVPGESGELGSEGNDVVVEQLKACQKEVHCLKEKIAELEMQNTKLTEDCKKFQSSVGENSAVIATSNELNDKEKNLMKTVEELEQLLIQEKAKSVQASNEKQITESNLSIAQELTDCKKELKSNTEELRKTKSDLEKSVKELSALKKELDEKTKTKDTSKVTSDFKSKLEALQKTVCDLQSENEKLKEKEKSKPSIVGPKDKEPASWRWEKQELEKQAKELKKKFEDLQAEMKKSMPKSKDVKKDDSKETSKLSEECEQYKKQLEEMKKKLTEVDESLKKMVKEKEKAEKGLKEAIEKSTKDKTEVSKTKDMFSKQKDDATEDKKKLTKDLETEKKRNEALNKEKEQMTKEKEEWTSEKKRLVQERDAAIKETEETHKEKSGKDSEDVNKRSTPFGLRSKTGIVGKTSDGVVSNSAKMKELMETLEKKEAELQALKAEPKSKEPSEKPGFKAREVSELRKDKEKVEKELEKSAVEKKILKSEIQDLKDKLKSIEDGWLKDKSQLEQDLKQANDKSRSTAKGFRTTEDPKSVQEKETLIKEKLKLIEEVTKLKKDLGDVGKQRNSEKDEFEKKLKDKTKSFDDSKASNDELQKENERLKAQVGNVNSKAASGSSKAITIPVQQDRSVKSIPIQKVSKLSSNSSDEQDPALIKAELIALEETYRSRTNNLEDELNSLREQLSSVQKESKIQSQKSQKSFAELKTNFEKELNSWNKERELLKKSGKLVDEHGTKVSQLDATIEELHGKLKAEEGKRRELEVKLVAQENVTKVDKTATSVEEKSKVQEEKSAIGQKTAEFRNRFEKFGGTPRPARKLSLPSSSSSSATSLLSDTTEKGDWVGEIQRQMTESEKARLKDREDLLEKLERQKKDFELKLEAFKETTKLLDTRSQELSALEKKIVEFHCQLEEERTSWSEEKSKLQSKITDAQKSGREDKDKIADLTGEVKKFQVLSSSGKSGAASLSGISSPLTPSTPLGTEKPGFKVKSKSSDSSQNSAPSPVTSIVIPIRKVDEVKKPLSDDTAAAAAQAATPTSNGVGKLQKKIFPPFATDSTQNSSSSTKPYTSGQRTTIPINRINRSNPPKL